MPENGKAGAYAPAFLSERSPLEKMPLVRQWEGAAEAGSKEGYRLSCTLLEEVFQRLALQVVPSDIFLIISTKGLWREEEDMFRAYRNITILQKSIV